MQADALSRFFGQARARLRALTIARAVSIALACALPLIVARWFGALSTVQAGAAGAVVAAVAAAIGLRRAPKRDEDVALVVERRTDAPKNVLVTAAEVDARRVPLRDDVRDVLFRDAADAAAKVDLAALFPLRRALALLLIVAAVWTLGLTADARMIRRAAARTIGGTLAAPASIGDVTITITPPAYIRRSPSTVTNPDRLDVIAGSVLHVVVSGTAAHVDLIGVGERHALAPAGAAFAGDVTATTDGFIALQPFGADESAGVRRVLPLAVTPDRPPIAHITAPGKDLFIDKPTQSIPVTIDATDDFGLTSLTLAYTKVTGGGENFTFVSGEFPVTITRTAPEHWTAAGQLPLPSLGLEPGDMLVYRAVVADDRPNAAVVESDAFIVQRLMPGSALAEGITLDEDKDKYAISQQMVIIKTQRLIADKPKLSAEEFADRAQTIAAEQKKIRAEFVFMMGGEFEDAGNDGSGELNEQEEAANESELAAGRMQNNGRRDVILATRFMSSAVLGLTNLQPAAALPQEKSALAALQRAFTKSRYLLRFLAPRERVDDSRRLSGKLDGAGAWRRPVPEPADDSRTSKLLQVLAQLGGLAGLPKYSAAEANELAASAEALLKLDPALAQTADRFSAASRAIGAGQSPQEVASLVDAAAVALAAQTRAGAVRSPVAPDVSMSRLEDACADALRRGSRR